MKPTQIGLLGIALVTASVTTACGSSSAPKPASKSAASALAAGNPSASAAPTPTPTPTPPSSSAGRLVVTGALSLTFTENTTNTARRCDPGPTAAAPITGMIPFESGDKGFVLQLVSLPKGRSILPGSKVAIAFYNGTVSAQEWGAGLTKAAGNGLATLSADGKTGTVNLTMTQAAPAGSAAMAPIHVSGSFSC